MISCDSVNYSLKSIIVVVLYLQQCAHKSCTAIATQYYMHFSILGFFILKVNNEGNDSAIHKTQTI